MAKKKSELGYATIGCGSPDERKIAIDDYVSGFFVEGRTITICTLENNEGITVQILNPPTSGRTTQQMWVSEKSLAGLFAALSLYYQKKNIPIEEILSSAVDGGELYYTFAPNKK